MCVRIATLLLWRRDLEWIILAIMRRTAADRIPGFLSPRAWGLPSGAELGVANELFADFNEVRTGPWARPRHTWKSIG